MSIDFLIATSQNLLQNFALNQGLIPGNATLAFGNHFNIIALESLTQQLIQGDFTALPTVEIKSQSDLGGANGVYVREFNQIFLAQEFIDNASESQIVAVILEEYGHGIDALINSVDSPGDEGFIFSALVRGESLSDEQWALVTAENDGLQVIIDGQIYQAEANTSLVVDTLDDEDDGIGVGGISLRDALGAIADGGTITFDDSIANGTIILNSNQLVIDKSVTIDGDTDNITISGNDNSRVFNINDDDNNTDQIVNISNLTITGGNISGKGGGIHNRENLTLSNSTISGNSATGVGGDGGGIYSQGTTYISNSTISNNSATRGGGVFNSGTANITSSTISNNYASIDGGGVFNSGTANITSSIVSGNNALNNGDEVFLLGGGEVTANANNLFGDSSKSDSDAFDGFTPGENDINATSDGINVALENILDPNGLQDNGGTTQTIALVEGSPAIDAGSNPQGLITDQRGAFRDDGNGVDIGAYELLTEITEIVVDTEQDIVNGDFSPGDRSLREALLLIADGGTITFDPTVTNIILNGTELTVNKSVMIDGDGDNDGVADVTVDGDGQSRVFNVDDGDNISNSTIEMNGLNITGGQITGVSPDGDGAGIFNAENLTVSNSEITGNMTENDGGGIFNNYYGYLSVVNTVLTGNYSYDEGGAISNEGYATITDSQITDNISVEQGGGVSNLGGFIGIDSTTISNNQAGNDGGGIANEGLCGCATVTITNSQISGNTSDDEGGGIYNNYGSLEIYGTTISDNQAGDDGGGIATYNGESTIVESIISGNIAIDDGGGIANDSAFTAIYHSSIYNNVAGEYGGGVYSDGSLYGARLLVERTTISGNQASDGSGGGIANQYDSDAIIVESTISGNMALGTTNPADGGGINNYQADLGVYGSTISNNYAYENGGGIWTGSDPDDFQTAIVNSTISGNDAYIGGGLFQPYGDTSILNSTITNNYGAIDGSGVAVVSGSYSTISFGNSIIAGNFGNTDVDTDPSASTSPFISAGGNLVGGGDAIVLASFNGLQDQTGIFNPLLGSLTDNGGFQTGAFSLRETIQTHNPQANSPVINGGLNINSDLPFDGRGEGFLRIEGVIVDIGAVEFVFNTIEGTTGNDTLIGTDEPDEINALSGDDLIRAGDGKDVINGEEGKDRLYGDADNDIINGDEDDDFIDGGADNDLLSGGDGNDLVYGGDGNDTLLGDIGNDYMLGEQGDDLIDGGLGSDRLRGGTGFDIFVLRSGDGRDIIYDFTDGIDRIGLVDGLTFTDLGIAQFGSRTDITQITNQTDSNAVLALLVGVNFTNITEDDFLTL
ncbi:MAG: choice-of-anchor Q domain-containing protein [Microcystaceae cyanobacterium]